MVGGGIAGVFADCSSEILFGLSKLPVVIGFDKCQRCPCLRRMRIQLQCSYRLDTRLGVTFAKWDGAVGRQQGIGISQSGMSLRVIGIDRNSLLKLAHGVPQAR